MRVPRLSLGARFLLVLIRGYKLFASPYFYGSCRFVPSCADYAREAVMRHGALRGSWLALTRLARCHPLFSGGLDPVPTQSFSKQIVLANDRSERIKRAAVGAGGGAPAQSK